jgi:5'-nucleotidase (lipoprotein e(P4) family)
MFDDTYVNLVKEGFPVKKNQLLMMDKDRSKEPRRLEVAKKHEIVLLVGDNLSDHHKDFDARDNAARNAAVDTHKNLFGEKFIVLPNPLYGDWERAMPYDRARVDLLKVEP